MITEFQGEEVDPSKQRLTLFIWDAMLTAQRQDEQWKDEDTCRLAVQKILNNGPVEYADIKHLP